MKNVTRIGDLLIDEAPAITIADFIKESRWLMFTILDEKRCLTALFNPEEICDVIYCCISYLIRRLESKKEKKGKLLKVATIDEETTKQKLRMIEATISQLIEIRGVMEQIRKRWRKFDEITRESGN